MHKLREKCVRGFGCRQVHLLRNPALHFVPRPAIGGGATARLVHHGDKNGNILRTHTKWGRESTLCSQCDTHLSDCDTILIVNEHVLQSYNFFWSFHSL